MRCFPRSVALLLAFYYTAFSALSESLEKKSRECMKGNMASRLKEVFLTLSSALVGTHLEYCNQLWGPQQKELCGPVAVESTGES